MLIELTLEKSFTVSATANISTESKLFLTMQNYLRYICGLFFLAAFGLILTVNTPAQNNKSVPSSAPTRADTRRIDSEAAKTQGNSVILVISKNDRTLSFIDPAQMKEIARISVPGGPHELAVSADNRFAYLANYYQADEKLGRSISVIDIAARKEIKKIELGALEMLHGVVETGGKFYFTSEQTRTVARYNTVTESVDWIRGTGQSLTHIPVASPDGKRLYVTNMNSDSVTMIDIEGSGQEAAAIKQISVGSRPEGIAISPDGKELWVGHNGDGGISIVDATALAVKKTFKAGTMPIRIKFTADGKRVIVVDPRTSEVIIYEAATAREIKRIPVAGGPVSFAFSPDEKQIAVSLLNIAKAAIVYLESGKVLGTVPVGNVPDGIVWIKSPR